jgi:hypothetical protein
LVWHGNVLSFISVTQSHYSFTNSVTAKWRAEEECNLVWRWVFPKFRCRTSLTVHIFSRVLDPLPMLYILLSVSLYLPYFMYIQESDYSL